MLIYRGNKVEFQGLTSDDLKGKLNRSLNQR